MKQKPREALLESLVRVAFAVMAVLNKIGAEQDLSLTQIRVCGILRDRRLRMATLAEYLGLEKSTMTGMIDRSEKRGLVQRTPNPEDGRAIDVYLTRAGEELVDRLRERVHAELAPFTGQLDASEQRTLRELLARMLVDPA